MKTDGKLIYEEKVSSKWTEELFLGLTVLFLLLSIWCVSISSLDVLAVVSFCLFALFLFYSANYRTLTIRITEESLKLIFGVFVWTVPFENIEECQLDDDLPVLAKYGGAGIHFLSVRKRYRASFNFLEHPRVVIALKKKAGLVRDVSFSTRQPDQVIQIIQRAISTNTSH